MSQTPSTPAAKIVLTGINGEDAATEYTAWGVPFIEFRYENDGSPSYIKVPHALAAEISAALAAYAAKEA